MVKVNFTLERIAAFKCEINPKTNTLKYQSLLWDTSTPGLGLRVTRAGIKSFIFRSKLDKKELSITIGSPEIWSLQAAQAEAQRLKEMIDKGQDFRQAKAEGLEAEQAARNAKKAEKLAIQIQLQNESITLGDVWAEYVKVQSPKWSKNHIKLHREIMQTGGALRGQKLTGAGALDSLASLRLIDLTIERMEAWVKVVAIYRPSSGRQAMQVLYSCLNWCAAHPVYGAFMTNKVTKNAKAPEPIGSAKIKHHLLQPEQLAVWFDFVKQIKDPVSCAYLQCLLLTGADYREMATLRWVDIDTLQNSLTLSGSRDGCRLLPLTPYVAHLLDALPRRNGWVFSSPTVPNGKLAEPRHAYTEVIALVGLKRATLRGLRHNFARLCEWTETPVDIVAQIQGLAPQGVRDQEYVRRPLALLRMWHIEIEAWMLEQAQINFAPIEEQLLTIS